MTTENPESREGLRKLMLLDEWVIIAPERGDRPHQIGLSEIRDPGGAPCPFCPENIHLTPPTIDAWEASKFEGAPWGIRAIPNRYPAVRVEAQTAHLRSSLHEFRGGVGAHEVIVECPDHLAQWQQLGGPHIAEVMAAWQARMNDLRGDQRLRCAIIFKNHGAHAGATLVHSHSQLVALPLIPTRLKAELAGARDFWRQHSQCPFCQLIEEERARQDLIILDTGAALALAPYASRMPFETWILPTDHSGNFLEAAPETLEAVAEVAVAVLQLWEQALGPVAYNLVLHCLPFDLRGEPYYHWHLEMLPRTGRVAGFEWGSDLYINSTPPEEAAHHLRQLAATASE